MILLLCFAVLFQFYFKFKFFVGSSDIYTIDKKRRRWREIKEQEGNLELLLAIWFIFICTLEPCAIIRAAV